MTSKSILMHRQLNPYGGVGVWGPGARCASFGEPWTSNHFYNVQPNICWWCQKSQVNTNTHVEVTLHSCEYAWPGVTRGVLAREKGPQGCSPEKGVFDFHFPPNSVLGGGCMRGHQLQGKLAEKETKEKVPRIEDQEWVHCLLGGNLGWITHNCCCHFSSTKWRW